MTGSRPPIIAVVALRRAQKGHPVRDHLHHLMLGSLAILVFAGLHAALDSQEPAALDDIGTVFRKTVEDDHRKPGHSLALFSIGLPVLVDGDREPAERDTIL